MCESERESAQFSSLWLVGNWAMLKSCKGHLWQINVISHFIPWRIFTHCTLRGALTFIAPPGGETYGGSMGTNFMIWITNQCMSRGSAVERLADNKTSCFCNSHFNRSVTKYGFAVTQVCKKSWRVTYPRLLLLEAYYHLWDYATASDQWFAFFLPSKRKSFYARSRWF